MRPILFKGKRVDNGEWVEGYYWKNIINGKTLIIIGNIKDAQMYPVIPETLEVQCDNGEWKSINDVKII